MGLIPPLVTEKTAIISDELNHNCIINAIALGPGRPKKHIYKHPRHGRVGNARPRGGRPGAARRAIVVTDGIFSMPRRTHAPLDRIMELAQAHDGAFRRKTRS